METSSLTAMGLSPRVRGNPPYNQSQTDRPSWVYPRVCGGTSGTVRCALDRTGLSPRVRGNPLPLSSSSIRLRSIPACAGEPGVS